MTEEPFVITISRRAIGLQMRCTTCGATTMVGMKPEAKHLRVEAFCGCHSRRPYVLEREAAGG